MTIFLIIKVLSKSSPLHFLLNADIISFLNFLLSEKVIKGWKLGIWRVINHSFGFPLLVASVFAAFIAISGSPPKSSSLSHNSYEFVAFRLLFWNWGAKVDNSASSFRSFSFSSFPRVAPFLINSLYHTSVSFLSCFFILGLIWSKTDFTLLKSSPSSMISLLYFAKIGLIWLARAWKSLSDSDPKRWKYTVLTLFNFSDDISKANIVFEKSAGLGFSVIFSIFCTASSRLNCIADMKSLVLISSKGTVSKGCSFSFKRGLSAIIFFLFFK